MRSGRTDLPLRSLLDAVGWHDAPIDRLSVEERPKVLATPWPIAPMAAAALGAVGLAVSRLRELRTGEVVPVGVDTRAAELAMASSSYLGIEGKPAKFRDPLTGFYQAAAGEWVYLHGNFPHLRQGILDMLGVDDADRVAAEVLKRSAAGIEAEAIARGLCAARVRGRDEWLSEERAEQGGAEPPLHLQRVGDAPAAGLSASPRSALNGVRVLDLSRVIAGPMAGRTLAEHGATVLRVAAPHLPSIKSLVVDTGFGKRSAFLDLENEAGRESFMALATEADIFLDAYRPGSLERRGFGASRLRQINPGLISLSLSAFSPNGRWAGRRGYDSIVQATVGMAADAKPDRPALLPCQPLDYLTGYLAAFASMVALIRRHEEGGQWQARLSLEATSGWMWRMRAALGDDVVVPDANPAHEEVEDLIESYDTAFGRVAALRPALLLNGQVTTWGSLPVPLGTHPPLWPRS